MAATTLSLGGVNAAVIGYPEAAALTKTLAVASGCAPNQIFVSGMGSNASGVAQVGIVLRADSSSAVTALAAALDQIMPVLTPTGGLIVIRHSVCAYARCCGMNLRSATFVASKNPTKKAMKLK